jgi:hypothetical protein
MHFSDIFYMNGLFHLEIGISCSCVRKLAYDSYKLTIQRTE